MNLKYLCFDMLKVDALLPGKQWDAITQQDRQPGDGQFVNQVLLQEALNGFAAVDIEFFKPFLI